MIKVIGIGFLGLGVIGSELLSILREKEQYLLEKYKVRFEVKAILVRDINKKRNVEIQGLSLTADAKEVIENPEVQICIECMGGEGAVKTLDMVLTAMQNKKHIVMSSKKCLALYAEEIIAAANQNDVQLRVEATVGGAIPICRALMQMSGGDEITKIYGIVNGTSNYILSEIEASGKSYEEALQSAQIKGYAENDPTEDVDGWDAAYKMRILLRLGMGMDIAVNNLEPESIRNIKINEVKSKELCTKQMIYAEKSSDNEIDYYVGQVELEKENLFSKVSGNYNMIFIESKHSGTRAFYGKGAGGEATAAVMLDDLIDTVFGNYRYEPAITAITRNIQRKQLQL
jgi:homoserine dehydrogenase